MTFNSQVYSLTTPANNAKATFYLKSVFFALACILSFSGANAQGQSLVASPIPDDAEHRFCYYADLSYSLNSLILLTGSNEVTIVSEEKQQQLLECVITDDGIYKWVATSSPR